MQAGRSHLHSHYSERPAIATPMGGVCPQQRQVRNCLTRHRFARADTRALFGRKAQHRLRARPTHRRPPAIRLAPRRPTAHRNASHTSYRALLRCMSRCRGHAPSDNRMTHHSNFAGESHARKQRIDTATCTGARRLSNAGVLRQNARPMQAGRSHLHSHYSERPAIATPMGGVCPQQRQVRNCLTRHRFARADTRALFGRKAQHRLRARPTHRRPPAIRLAPRRPTAHRNASHTSYRALLRCMSRCRGHAPSDNRMTHHSNFAGESHARKQRIDTATCTGARRLSNACVLRQTLHRCKRGVRTLT